MDGYVYCIDIVFINQTAFMMVKFSDIKQIVKHLIVLCLMPHVNCDILSPKYKINMAQNNHPMRISFVSMNLLEVSKKPIKT